MTALPYMDECLNSQMYKRVTVKWTEAERVILTREMTGVCNISNNYLISIFSQ